MRWPARGWWWWGEREMGGVLRGDDAVWSAVARGGWAGTRGAGEAGAQQEVSAVRGRCLLERFGSRRLARLHPHHPPESFLPADQPTLAAHHTRPSPPAPGLRRPGWQPARRPVPARRPGRTQRRSPWRLRWLLCCLRRQPAERKRDDRGGVEDAQRGYESVTKKQSNASRGAAPCTLACAMADAAAVVLPDARACAMADADADAVAFCSRVRWWCSVASAGSECKGGQWAGEEASVPGCPSSCSASGGGGGARCALLCCRPPAPLTNARFAAGSGSQQQQGR